MKTLKTQLTLVIVVFCTLVISSCTSEIFGIRGEGALLEHELELDDLKGVELKISGNLHLTQSNEQKIIIEAQQNIFDNIKTSVRNGIVEYEFDRNVKSHDGIDIYMSMKTLAQLSLCGAGNINTTTPFVTSEILTLNLSGSGDFAVEADALEIYSNISGSGNFYIATHTEYLQCGVSGSGDYVLAGKAAEADYSISGSGNYSAFALTTDKTTLRVSGSGDAHVLANDKLNVNISGSGNVWYKGSPDIVKSITGTGNITCAN